MKNPAGILSIFIAILLCMTMTCSKNTATMPVVGLVVGSAELTRSGETGALPLQTRLRFADTITVSSQSKVKLLIGDSNAVLLNHSTILAIDTAGAMDSFPCSIRLLTGEVHAELNTVSGNKQLFITPNTAISCSASNVAISYDRVSGRTVIICLAGTITAVNSDKEIPVPPCTKLLVEDLPSDLFPIIEQEVVHLRNWVGRSAVEGPLSMMGCLERVPSGNNLPPEWQRLPREVCSLGETMIDTVIAVDPEGRKVKYLLVSGPPGISIDSARGLIRFEPGSAGKFDVHLRAVDRDSGVADFSYTLHVAGELAVLLSAPRIIGTGESFTITASPLRKTVTAPGALRYRFDTNGDGTFDWPKGGAFGTSPVISSHSYAAEGTYRIAVEIRDSRNQIASSSRFIVVNNPPAASISVEPAITLPGAPVKLDASKSADTRDRPDQLAVRWDVNNDGIWDIPRGGSFSHEKQITYAWENPGTYKVIVQVRDSLGAMDTAAVQVRVTNRIMIDSLSGPASASVGDTVQFTCHVTKGEFPVTSYAWSFDGDTVYEKETGTSSVRYAFTGSGAKKVVCKITDQKGFTARKERAISIAGAVTAAPEIEAGGPYVAAVNSMFSVEGAARSKDSKITNYSWDFDGDGKPEWNSATNTKASHTFTRAGKHTIIFAITTDDGAIVYDSAIVTVSNKGPVAKAGADIVVRANKKVTLKGTGEDSDGNIVKYEWDFDNDGTFDWSSAETGEVEHAFANYSYAILRVTDTDGAFGFDTIRVVVCPDDMRVVEKGLFCVDLYEWPNKRGNLPQVNITYEEALKACAGVGKRLCTADEWQTACRNEEEQRQYPYGTKFDVERCNSLGNALVKNKMSVSGYFEECKGPTGVYDMSGNVAEWTYAGDDGVSVYGGSYQNGEDGSTCVSHVRLQKGRKYFYAGFRCCK
jgi:PKD repeat protein